MWDKFIDLERQIPVLKQRLGAAERSGEYLDFEVAMKQVLVVEGRLRAVRALARAHARKAKLKLQAVCPHEHRVATSTRYDADTKVSTPLSEACTDCGLQLTPRVRAL